MNVLLDYLATSQNTMYCGGEPEQHHNTHILIVHKHVFMNPLQLACLQITGARYYKLHTMQQALYVSIT